MRVRQILITYFNRRLDNKFTKALDDRWLKHRWELFNTFTVPSIRAQTCTDFDWVILYHEHSPNWLKGCAEAIKVPCRMRPSFDSIDPALGEIDAALGDLKDPSFDVILTTRVDSDDALHRCAMARIRETFETNSACYEVLNFETGYQYDCSSQRLAIVQLTSPPFSTKINRDPILNPLDLGGFHTELPKKYKYCNISRGDPMFLQIIHDCNIANKLRPTSSFLSRSLSRHILQEAFNVTEPVRKIPLCSYLYEIKYHAQQMWRASFAIVNPYAKAQTL